MTIAVSSFCTRCFFALCLEFMQKKTIVLLLFFSDTGGVILSVSVDCVNGIASFSFNPDSWPGKGGGFLKHKLSNPRRIAWKNVS